MKTPDVGKMKDTVAALEKDVADLDASDKLRLAMAGAGDKEASLNPDPGASKGTTPTKGTKPTATKPPESAKKVDKKDLLDKLSAFEKELADKKKSQKK
jgi:hypothetical protein